MIFFVSSKHASILVSSCWLHKIFASLAQHDESKMQDIDMPVCDVSLFFLDIRKRKIWSLHSCPTPDLVYILTKLFNTLTLYDTNRLWTIFGVDMSIYSHTHLTVGFGIQYLLFVNWSDNVNDSFDICILGFTNTTTKIMSFLVSTYLGFINTTAKIMCFLVSTYKSYMYQIVLQWFLFAELYNTEWCLKCVY